MITDSTPFSKQVTKDALEHAQEVYPQESCGLVLNGMYQPCKNVADSPEKTFKIAPTTVAKAMKSGTLDGVWHSHPEGMPNPSITDMEQQIATNVPWGVHVFDGGVEPNYLSTFTWGDHTLKVPLLERSWVSGIYDCFGLIRSYFFQVEGWKMADFAREGDWWDHTVQENFRRRLDSLKEFEVLPAVAIPQVGDVVLMAIRSSDPNHFGVISREDMLLHHMSGSLSSERPFVTLQGTITHLLRRKGRVGDKT